MSFQRFITLHQRGILGKPARMLWAVLSSAMASQGYALFATKMDAFCNSLIIICFRLLIMFLCSPSIYALRNHGNNVVTAFLMFAAHVTAFRKGKEKFTDLGMFFIKSKI